MQIGLGIGIPFTKSQVWLAVQAVFTPAKLFESGANGLWLDPSDLTTMFQDSAGTTPVTAEEQPVGLILDKSKGGVGTNGTKRVNLLTKTEQFDDAAWTKIGSYGPAFPAPTFTTYTGTNPLGVTGTIYRFTFPNVTAANGFSILYQISATPQQASVSYRNSIYIKRVSGGSQLPLSVESSASGPPSGGYSTSVMTVTDSWVKYAYNATLTGVIGGNLTQMIGPEGRIPSHLNLGEITVDIWGADLRLASEANTLPLYQKVTDTWYNATPGNHAFQSTSANRPTLSARYNLLTKTERFFETWTPDNVTVSTGNFIKENTATAAHDTYQTYTALPIGSYTFTVAVSKTFVGSRNFCIAPFGSTGVGGTGSKGIVFNQTGQFVSFTGIGTDPTYSVTEYSDRFVVSVTGFTTTQATAYPAIYLANGASTSYAGDNTSGMTLLYASLVPANQASLPYQRVNTATDYDTDATKFPRYLKFNGTSSSMQTASINFTATDKMFVSAGVRKLSDSDAGMVLEFTSSTDSTDRSFYLLAPYAPGATVGFGTRGSSLTAVYASGYTSPVTLVATASYNNGGATQTDEIKPRINGAVVSVVDGGKSTTAGTGNYGNYPLYIGARAGTALFFNGNLYQLVIAGKQASAEEIDSTENYIELKTFGKDMSYVYDYLVDSTGNQITDSAGNPIYVTQTYQ